MDRKNVHLLRNLTAGFAGRLETENQYFDYAPARAPPQGRWKISGINLPDPILIKLYYEHAARLLHIVHSPVT